MIYVILMENAKHAAVDILRIPIQIVYNVITLNVLLVQFLLQFVIKIVILAA